MTTAQHSDDVQTLHERWTVVTPEADGRGNLTRLSAALQKYVAEIWSRKKEKVIKFPTGHVRHKLGKHQAVGAVKAVHAHNCHDDMHQYVMTNLSLRDTIRRRVEQAVIGWRERRLTAKERKCCIKDQLCQEDGDTALSSPQSHRFVLFISRSAQDIGGRPNCLKRANLRQQVLSCLILGSGWR